MSRPQDNRLPYLPGIDALRAIAVLAVAGVYTRLIVHAIRSATS